jgi:hypothetical protein
MENAAAAMAAEHSARHDRQGKTAAPQGADDLISDSRKWRIVFIMSIGYGQVLPGRRQRRRLFEILRWMPERLHAFTHAWPAPARDDPAAVTAESFGH